MYEFHGWITVRETPANVDEEGVDGIVDRLREYIERLHWESGVLDIRPVNGAFQVWAAGFHNHRPTGNDDPVELFRHVGEMAPGSYGLLYVWDDEDASGFHNKFRAYVLARGELHEREDPFLSPCVPVIEDEWQGE